MALPAGFTFSQASLQDYSDCPRRFQLRYVLGVRWPAAQDGAATQERAEWEKKALQGAAFHRLVHQHTVGIPQNILADSITDPELRVWWQSYLHTPPPNLPAEVRRSEVRLSVPLDGYRLMARYDLLAVAPGQRAIIVDWKTSRLRAKRATLENRWQTRVYRYVLVEAGAQLNERTALTPAQVELIYWFTNFPQRIERLPYDDRQYRVDQTTLQSAIAGISARDQEQWTLTGDLEHCRYCTYRTLCEREPVDAPEPDWEPQEEPEDWEIDLEQVGEIAF
jgi:CRISPR/Cas system-associated exonuclease Cas4 (RecB family)